MLTRTKTCWTSSPAITVAAFLLLSAATEQASTAELIEVSVSGGSRWMHSDSVAPITGESDRPAVLFTASTPLPWRTLGDFEPQTELGYEYGTIDGALFDSFEPQLALHTWSAGVRLRRRLHALGSAFVRGRLGYIRGVFSMDANRGELAQWRDVAHAVGATLGVGIDLHVASKRSPVSGGLRLAADYSLVSPLSVSLDPVNPDDGIVRLPSGAASLGDINVSSVGLHLGLFLTY